MPLNSPKGTLQGSNDVKGIYCFKVSNLKTETNYYLLTI